MFKRSRRKIVAAIMSILTVLWLGTLAVIYISSYYEVYTTNMEMLKGHAAMYSLSKPINDMEPGRPNISHDDRLQTNQFKLSTFYTAAVSYDGEILEIKNDEKDVFTDAQIEAIAKDVLSGGYSSGATDDLIYYRTDKGGYILIALMDNTILRESMGTLFRYTLIFGGMALIGLFFLAQYLARRIVQPLEESYKKQKQFISDAGHELKTPISVVNANAELLSRELGENQWLQNIQYENERMGLLVKQLLDLARTENVTQEKNRVDFSRLVNGEALPFEGVAFEKGLILRTSITQELTVYGNAAQLRQLVAILLDNAIRHTTDGKDVWLSLVKEHGQARLSVINVGDEIPVQERTQLFERFYRMDSARNGDDGHYGLGLAIAKAVSDAHHGQIGVRCDNGFVEFRIMLPLA